MRTCYCGELNESHIGQSVDLYGWAHRRRDHGGVIFIDLRDREGLAQVVIDPDDPEMFAIAESVRGEYVLRIKGDVRKRPEGTINPKLPSGHVEVLVREIEILNKSETIPFTLDETDVNENSRLKYRYVDLRRDVMRDNMVLRAEVIKHMRRFLEGERFMEMETPILTRSTPEGARDYLVPSRTNSGQFFALPQSPQLFKQLLMISGFDRYYQIARCFRDEDLRADRQPEFTQLDIETSFMNQDEIMALMEAMMRYVFKQVLDVNLPDMPRMTYAEAIQRFGTDRPDLRNPLELVDLADVMANVEFKVFSGPANDPAGRIAALHVPGGASMPRKAIDDYTKYVAQFGARGLAYIKVNEVGKGRDGLQSPILKFLPDEAVNAIIERTGAKDGDLIFFGADKAGIVNDALGNLRVLVGEDQGLLKGDWAPVWIVDFPMFEKDKESGRWQALHHPFTAPAEDDSLLLEANPGAALSRAYDMVLNGTEIGGGSERIHDTDMQSAVLRILGITDDEAQNKFGFLLEALKYGAPPHGGMAFGVDRVVAMMSGAESIRDVIAFPKTQRVHCPLTDAPDFVDDKVLRELNIKLRKIPDALKPD